MVAWCLKHFFLQSVTNLPVCYYIFECVRETTQLLGVWVHDRRCSGHNNSRGVSCQNETTCYIHRAIEFSLVTANCEKLCTCKKNEDCVWYVSRCFDNRFLIRHRACRMRSSDKGRIVNRNLIARKNGKLSETRGRQSAGQYHFAQQQSRSFNDRKFFARCTRTSNTL